ncbi:arsenate reductase (glutaredoxin) [Alteromonas sediminis]|uniref:Arsenate reductase n=1 Tax=Alteromonas sediminis TaxID=2259342 RepID=A0A3N5Y3N9_9ALTE|nr:arsenate reductase (glutaredoxin) [Alteromonas sediminis]RPJ67466.1 arsenate reductase (glutaredoxin) [Alteromonas sediminis]
MSSIKILHNPRCSKSRQTLALIENAGIEPEIVLYLNDPPSEQCLEQLKTYLKIDSIRAITRTKEALYKELGLANETQEAALIKAIHTHPKLLERPIVIKHSDAGIQACIGRPPENVLDLLP